MKKGRIDSNHLHNMSAVLILIAFPLMYMASWNFEAWWKWPGLILFGIGLLLPVLSPLLSPEVSDNEGGEICADNCSHPGGIKQIYNGKG